MKWLGYVNGMVLRYLMRRRLTENFKGDLNIAGRRAECLRLVEIFEGFEAEHDPEATEAEMKIRFDRAMDRVSDVSEDCQQDDAKRRAGPA